jgi:hypothetical protein
MTTKSKMLVLLLLVPACNKPAQKNPPPPQEQQRNPVLDLPEAYAEKAGLVRLTFRVPKFIGPKQYGQGATLMTLEARHQYTTMRFDIVVGRNGVAFMSPGGTGDQFYQVLDQVLKTKSKPRTMRAATDFKHEVLKGNPTELDKGPVKLQLKHANGARFLLIVDLKAKKVTIREIARKYRRRIIQAFQV